MHEDCPHGLEKSMWMAGELLYLIEKGASLIFDRVIIDRIPTHKKDTAVYIHFRLQKINTNILLH
jgi:catabolite regulation protein CreA